ncbi:hypothetical protein JKP88DRAFT_349424 [Tribonema minus]|uniref:Pre-rRNA-processing protein Ipi1 N-terminal domain-containing protein n=1 Tax=Tribonema minus TaxID=303371 RepID=A0A835YVI7_9STRA|nr:hypothetical protein JKP88DRAFT_349424 [Tribonema minus]
MVKSKGFLQKASKSKSTADFKHLKSKVGKKAAKPLSHTDTSFKSKKLFVAKQSILADKEEGEPTSARGHTLSELQIQLKHYATATKKDALLGLRSLLARHPGIAQQRFAALSEGALDCLKCEEGSVRSLLLEYMYELLRDVSTSTLAPFGDIMLAYTISAITQLDRGVRKDGLSMLALLLARCPALVAARAHKLWPIYPPLLASDPAGKKQTIRSSATASLVALLQATTQNGKGSPAPGAAAAAAPELVWQARSSQNAVLLLRAFAPVPATLGSQVGDAGDAQSAALLGVLPEVLDRLLEVWVDASGLAEAAAGGGSGSSGIASAASDPAQLQLVADAALLLLRHPAVTAAAADAQDSSSTGSAAAAAVATFHAWLERQYFPAAMAAFPLRAEGSAAAAAAAALNTTLCELTVAAGSSAHTPAAVAYMRDMLERGGGGGGSAPAAAGGLKRLLTVLRAVLLQQQQRAAPGAARDARAPLLQAFGGYCEGLHGGKEAKAACAQFVCELVRTELNAARPGAAAAAAVASTVTGATMAQLCGWLRALPPLLPAWCASRAALAGDVLATLLEVARRTPPTPAATDDGAGHEEQQRRAAAAATAQLCAWLPSALRPTYAAGALLALPPRSQRTAAALLHHLPLSAAAAAALLPVLSATCGDPATPAATRSLLLEAAHHHRRVLTPSVYLTFLMGVLLGADVGADSGGGSASSAGAGGASRKCSAPGFATPADASPAESGAEAAWGAATARDAIAADVCLRLSDVASAARGAAVLAALVPQLSALLGGAYAGSGNSGGGGSSARGLRIAAAVALALLHATPPDARDAALLPLLPRFTAAAAALLGRGEAAAAPIHAPIAQLVRVRPSLLAALAEAAAAQAAAAAAAGNARSVEPLMLALQELVRRDTAAARAAGQGLVLAVSQLAECLRGSPVAALAQQLQADLELAVAAEGDVN